LHQVWIEALRAGEPPMVALQGEGVRELGGQVVDIVGPDRDGGYRRS
jgi:hypothetical protein